MRLIQANIIGLLLLGLMLAWGNASARVVEAEGAAPLQNLDRTVAREQAIQAAVRQALLQTAMVIQSSSTVTDHELVEDISSISTVGLVRDVTVLKEWTQDAVLHVLVRAQVLEDRLAGKQPPVRHRKKIAALQFHVTDRAQLHDMPGLEQEMPREILRRMENANRILLTDGTAYYVNSEGKVMFEGKAIAVNEAVGRIARSLGVQFVVMGTLRDFSVQRGLRGILRDFTLQRLVTSAGRHAQMDVTLYDGISGTVISRRRLNEWVSGATDVKGGIRFGDTQFLKSDFGKTLDRMIDQVSQGIAADIDHIPLSARVIKAEGKRITLDIGISSLIRVGDILKAYRVATSPTEESGSGKYLGHQELLLSTLVVRQTQPQFAVGELEVEGMQLKPGDIVRLDGG